MSSDMNPEGARKSLAKAFLVIALITAAAVVLTVGSIVSTGAPLTSLGEFAANLRAMDSETAFESATAAAQLLAAVLAIAITVVAIIVELAANRYSHRITSLFIREPVNIVVMSFFVVATIQSLWVSVSFGNDAAGATGHTTGVLISLVMVTLSLMLLLPYFAYVMSFLSPLSVINRIAGSAATSLAKVDSGSVQASTDAVLGCVDELQDIARRAVESGDRSVAMASIDALRELLQGYVEITDRLPETWFRAGPSIARDPDFVSLSAGSLKEIDDAQVWFEAKILRQYLALVVSGNPGARDTTNLIAINTKLIGIAAIGRRDALVDLCIRCFNSYMRAALNNRDQRSAYYIMNQYRLLGEALLRAGASREVDNVARSLQFYGQLGFKMDMQFLLEVAAFDVKYLIEDCIRMESPLVDTLMGLMMELDQEIKEEYQEESLLGVRRSQLQLAAFLAHQGDVDRAKRLCRDLATERSDRLDRVRRQLMDEDRPQYWEFTDRGVNFSFLPPELRERLGSVFAWIEEARRQ